jgi:hypothetical protein
MPKPTVPELIPLVRQYAKRPENNVGGDYHLLFEDLNWETAHVQHCLDSATAKGDELGMRIGKLLLQMSRTQRLKLAGMFYRLQEE